MNYSTNQTIISCKVTNDLLTSIEKYLRSSMISTLDFSPGRLTIEYEVKIQDNLGTESLKSIADYKPLGYNDSIKKLSFNLSCNNYDPEKPKNDERFYLELSFSPEKSFSEISIRIDTDKAKDKTIVILNNINQLIKPLRINRGIYHSPLFSFIMILPLYTFYFTSWIVHKGLYSLLVIAPILTLLFFSFAFFPGIIKPYCDFNTRRQVIINKYFSFLYWGLLGYIVFDIILNIGYR